MKAKHTFLECTMPSVPGFEDDPLASYLIQQGEEQYERERRIREVECDLEWERINNPQIEIVEPEVFDVLPWGCTPGDSQ